MSDGGLSCLIFLTVAIGIPIGLFGIGFAGNWWKDRGDRETRRRRKAVARIVARAVRDTGTRRTKTYVSPDGKYVSITTREDYEQRKALREALARGLAELDGRVLSTIEATDSDSIPRDPAWSHLSHAYGDASDIPYWLSKVTPDSSEEAWGELWSRLCHQGSVYDASFAALPALRDTARNWRPEDRAMPLSLAGAIAAGQHFRVDPDLITELRELTLESLRSSLDRDTFIVVLQALAAFEDIPVWHTELERLLSGELQVACPACELDLDIEIAACRPRTELTGAAARLHTLAIEAGQHEVAELLTRLFGETTCTCGHRFDVADAVNR